MARVGRGAGREQHGELGKGMRLPASGRAGRKQKREMGGSMRLAAVGRCNRVALVRNCGRGCQFSVMAGWLATQVDEQEGPKALGRPNHLGCV